jgi:hypothetical protein
LHNQITTQLSSSIAQKHKERQLAAENLDLHDLPEFRSDDHPPFPYPKTAGRRPFDGEDSSKVRVADDPGTISIPAPAAFSRTYPAIGK